MIYYKKKTVKMLSCLISLITFLNMAAFTITGQAYEIPFADITESKYKTAIDCVSALGFMNGYNDQTFQPDSNITRAEYVKIMVSILGLKNADTYNTNSPFEDVPDNHWAAGYVQSAYKLGLINGDENGLFNPDDDITYAEAVKILIRVLGYEILAQEKGGYPVGYIKIADNKKLFNDIDDSVYNTATRGAVAQLIYNSFDVDILEQIKFGEPDEYSVIDGNTILAKNNIAKVEGQITSNSKTSLIGNSNLHPDTILIDEIEYSADEQYADKYLGYNVVAYYKYNESTGEKIILYLHEQKGKNKTLILKSDDIEDIISGTDMVRTIKYWDEEVSKSRQQTADISSSADVIYNGKALLSYQTTDLVPNIGEIVLLDNNNDKLYDVVFITSYINYIVDNISISSGVISDKDGKPSLNLKDTNFDVLIHYNGNNVSIDEIQKDDVLSVADSKAQSGKINRTVHISRNKAKGIVSGLNEDSIEINEKKYAVSKSYGYDVEADKYGNIKYVENANVTPFKIGDEGLFHIDIYGNIAGFTREISSGKHIGYIINVAQTFSLDNTVMFKMITADKEIVTYKVADKIKYNGKGNITKKQLTDPALSFLTNAGATITNPIFTQNGIKQQLIYFELNGDMEIRSIDTKEYCIDEYEDSLQESSSMHSMKYNNAGTKIWSASAGGYIIDGDVKVFVIPSDASSINHEMQYAIKDKNFFVNKVWYSCELYNADDTRVTDLVVAKTPTSIHPNESLFIVDYIEEGINSSGEITINIYGLQNGKETVLSCSETMLPDSFKPENIGSGDVIRYITGYNGEVTFITLLYDADGVNNYMESSSNFETNPLFIYGKVCEKKGNIITVSGITEEDSNIIIESKAQPYSVEGTNIYICEDTGNKKILSVGSAADIQKQENVYLRIYDTKLRDIIVFRQ